MHNEVWDCAEIFPHFYSSKLVLEQINYTRFTCIVLVRSQRTDTLQVKRKDIYLFAFHFNFLSLGLGAFWTCDNVVVNKDLT